jgi:hypothetical protein
MRTFHFSSAAVVAAAFLIGGTLAPALSQQPPSPPPAPQPPAAQQPGQPQQQQLAPPKAYKPVTIKLPQPVSDPSFEPFRKQLAGIAERKDRAGLARLIARNFFWIPEDKDVADSKKPGIDNLAKAIGLDGREATGWDVLAGYAGDPTADPYQEKPGVICAPGDPQFDEKAAEELASSTQTDPAEWGYPVSDGIEVRSAAGTTAPIIEKLGLYLVRVYPDDSPASAVNAEFLRVVTPTGKLGFVPADSILPLAEDRICYVKEGNAWKIAGVIGGVPQ